MLSLQPYIYRLTIGLVLVVLLIGWQIAAPLPVAAQNAPAVQMALSNTVRYNAGISFSLKASTTQSRLEKAELRYRLGKEGLEQSRAADKFNAGTTIAAETRLQESQEDLAAGMPVSYYWLVTNSNGQQQASEKKTVYYEDTRFQWREINGSVVTLRWYRGDDRYGQQMYNLAADSLNTLKKRFSFQNTRQIYISIYAAKQDFFDVAPPNTPIWAGGMAYLERSEITLIAPQDSLATLRIGEGVPHEVTHIALYQTVGKQTPRWFDEGFAVYSQNIKSEDYYRIAKAAFEQNRLISFNSLVSSFPANSDAANLAYAQSASFIDFLINRYGDNVAANLFDQLRTNDIEEAMRATFGVGMAELVPQWHNFLQGKLISLPPALKTAPVVPQAATSSGSPTRLRLVDGGSLETSNKTSGQQFVPGNLFLAGVVVAASFLLVGSVLIVAMARRHRLTRTVNSDVYAQSNHYFNSYYNQTYETNSPYQPPANFYHSNASTPTATTANSYNAEYYVYPAQTRPWPTQDAIITPPPITILPPASTEPDPLDFIQAQFGQPPQRHD